MGGIPDRSLPDGDEIDRMRKQGHTFAEIGERYGVSRQAVHKAHKKWLAERELIVVPLA
jgi:DNA invertase Pin-like site-specific DNA recombinase